MTRLPRLLLATALLTLALAGSASAQATRTWVSGVGDDVNPCSRTAPCKTFAGAISKTAAGGEINAIDPGGYGAVTITKSITIDATGTFGSILNSLVNGVTVNAAPSDRVVLRGLDIMGGSQVGQPCAGLNGLRIMKAGSVRLEDSRVLQQQIGVNVIPDTDPVDVFLNRVDLANNCAHGIKAAPTGTGSADVTIRESTISGSPVALSADTGATAWLTGSTVFANALGLERIGGGVINDWGDNQVYGNATNGTPTAVVGPVAPAGPAGPAGAAGPAGPQGEPGPTALKVLLAAKTLTATTGSTVTLRYVATTDATSTLQVTRKGRTVATISKPAKAGANAITWRPKKAKAGRYKVVLRALGADGQVSTAKATLRLR